MVKNIFYVKIPFSNFKIFKGRPILIIKEMENDYLFLPLTSNLKKKGILLTNKDLKKGFLLKDSVIIVPKISAIDKSLVHYSKLIAIIKDFKYLEVMKSICNFFDCRNYYD